MVGGGAGEQPVAVVTGGANGIGAAIAETFGRAGTFVVTVDPGVAVDGTEQASVAGPTTADRIVAAGGAARSSNTSVTDRQAIEELFVGLVEEFGRLDVVVNVAGITRPSSYTTGSPSDWDAVLDVHLNGYLNVLRAALPIMAEAGRGRVLGVTSGSGWRRANAGAYSCAKRAVMALTWQLAEGSPAGVTVNALSPIAATRMVAHGERTSNRGGPAAAASKGGLSLANNVPPPADLGPIGAYLAGEEFARWCNGQVMFSNGSEVSWIATPRLIESAPSTGHASLSRAIDSIMVDGFAPAEASQATNGGSTPRFRVDGETTAVNHGSAGRAVVVTDDGAWGAAIGDSLHARGVTCVGVGEWPGDHHAATEFPTDFSASEAFANVVRDAGPIDSVVLAIVDPTGTAVRRDAHSPKWRGTLDEHTAIVEQIRNDAAWVRAVADYASTAERPVRIVTVTDATTAGGRSRASAAAQLARAAHPATEERVDAFAISVETSDESERTTVGELSAHLVTHPQAGSLSGAELVAASGWFGLRSHPNPAGTVTYGGPDLPLWLDTVLRRTVSPTERESIWSATA